MTRMGAGKDGRPFEREYDMTILGMAAAFGWLAHHNTDSRREIGDPGFPDWTFLHLETGRLLFVETKVQGGNLTKAQQRWLAAFIAGSHEGLLLMLPGGLKALEDALRG